MRIVIDMQGAQTGSRFRGIGRYTLSLALAIARNRGEHEIVLALNGMFPETIEFIRAAFAGLLPQENIRVWTAPGPVNEAAPNNHGRREVAERIREAFLASLHPDAVLVSSIFEGLSDDAVTSVGVLDLHIPTVLILYDLVPLINPDSHFRASHIHQNWYARKIDSVMRSNRLLSISESTRQEAVGLLEYAPQHIVNISCACDDSFRLLELTQEQKKHLFNRYGIVKPFIMYTGAAADERKNLKRLIEAYSLLPESIRGLYQLVIAGKLPEDYLEELSRSAPERGLYGTDIVMTGYVEDDDLIKLYNSCLLFVFPSLHEGFGIPPLEAMLCGAPVIAADATSLPEVIGRDDALFDPRSAMSIKNKLEEALTNETFRASLIAHGAVQAKKFSWDECAKRAIAVLQTLDLPKDAKREAPPYVEKTSIFTKLRRKILLIKLDHMGDFVLSIPAIAKIKARYPYARIDIVVGSWNAAMAASLGIFENIYTFDYFKKKSSELPSKNDLDVVEILGNLSDYDIAIDLRRQHETRFLLVETQAKLKVGYKTYDPAINVRLDIGLPVRPDVAFEKTSLNSTSTARQLLELVDALPDDANDFVLLPELGSRSTRDHASVAIFPLAGSSVREWTKPSYIALVDLLQRDARIHSINIYFGNAGESAGFEFKTAEKLNIHIGLDFQSLVRSVSGNAICVSNNSFGAHFGAYLGLIVIAVYSGHETPDEWAPVFGESYVIHTAESCSPCHQGQKGDCQYRLCCLTDITVWHVYDRIIESVDSASRREKGEGENAITTVPASKRRHDIVDELVTSIVALKAPVWTPQERLDILLAISRNHPHRAQPRQLLVDVSEIARSDAGTGIQRVVRSILVELLANPPEGYSVEPVRAVPGQQGYRYARGFASRFLGEVSLGADDPVDAYSGDVFVGLDLQHTVVAAQKAQLQDWHRNGVKIVFVIYDLLPILFPELFPDGVRGMHHTWLEIISQFDGAICISRSVADEFHGWLQVFGQKRKRPLSVSWFHLGADIENTLPTKGLPDNAGRVLMALKSRPSFLMVGTIEPRKGHAQVLAAFETLWREGVRANLVIVGKKGWLVEPLAEKLRKHRKRGDSLFWLEGISDEFLQKIYASSTCLILASEGEGFGLPLIEAAQQGLPAIARDLPVFREVAGNHAFYFFNDKSPETVAKAVREWLSLHRTGKSPRPDAMQWQNWKASTRQLVDATLTNEPYYAWLPDGILRYWGNDPRLYTQVGERSAKSIRTAMQGGYLLYGAYTALQTGRYRIALHGSASRWAGHEYMDIVAEQGNKTIKHFQLAKMNLGQWQFEGEFVLDTGETDVEFRVYVEGTTELAVDAIEVLPHREPDIQPEVEAASLEASSLPRLNIGEPTNHSEQANAEMGLPAGD